MEGYVRSIIPFSAVDGPGNRTVIFLQGCNFNCWYCHNPETIQIATASSSVDGVPIRTVEEVVQWVKPYFDFTSGITISGGECTVQATFLIQLCTALKEEGRHILIDTNGHMAIETLDALCQCCDGFMFDLKASDPKAHQAITGLGSERVIENCLEAAKRGLLYELRTVVALSTEKDGPFHAEETVLRGAEIIATYSPSTRYKLIQYRSHGVRAEKASFMKEPDKATMGRLFKLAKDRGVKEIILI